LKRVLIAVAVLLIAMPGQAQEEGGGDVPAGDAGAPSVTVVQVPQAGPAPTADAPPDINQHLPSSSKASSDTASSGDGFDLRRGTGASGSVKGSKGGAYIVSGSYVPELHTAKRGDTLWDLSGRYYGNAYQWPRVWSNNPQIQNPHWIYPGDHIRLRGKHVKLVGGGVRPAPTVAPDVKFSRHMGYVLDGKHPEWGEIIGSPEDQMLLSENDEVYIKLYEKERDHLIEPGTLLTVFEPRKVKNLTPFPLVWIRGIVVVNRYNQKTGMVRARIVESLDTIERGVRVGPMKRKIDVVKPVRNDKTVEAKIVGALYPFEFYGEGQTVFIDKGSDDGLQSGNRLFAVSRGDEWRLGLTNAGNMASKRALTEDDRMATVEKTPNKDEPRLYPAETYAELIVLRTREKTATCLVTASIHEIARGSIVIAREGY
jgi:hypothetical protein